MFIYAVKSEFLFDICKGVSALHNRTNNIETKWDCLASLHRKLL